MRRSEAEDAVPGLEALHRRLRCARGLDLGDLEHVVPDPGTQPVGDATWAVAEGETAEDRRQLIALVERARAGDATAFGELYGHYQPRVHRYLLLRTRSALLAEDLTSETFLRALRRVRGFRWQGRDFGAWLLTIARNLASDHHSAGPARLEVAHGDMRSLDRPTAGPESTVMAAATTDLLLTALDALPREQRACLELRFLQGRSIARTAEALSRSEGAVKQLQRRAVANLARRLPAEDLG